MKRNYINEIHAIKSRSNLDPRYNIDFRLGNLEILVAEYLNNNQDGGNELLKYLPIATVACFESFFRSVIKELIDSGKPYDENARQFNQSQNVKFDFEIILAIQGKTLTIGEFVSHILPCNNYNDINSNMSTLIGLDFTEEIKKHERESLSESTNENSNLFRQISMKLFLTLKGPLN